jgi:hypothetical protein
VIGGGVFFTKPKRPSVVSATLTVLLSEDVTFDFE